MKQCDLILNDKYNKCNLVTTSITLYCNLLNGYAFTSDSYIKLGQYKILTIGNVQNGYVSISNCNYINEIPKGMPNHCLLEYKDLLMSLTGNIGRVGFVIFDNCLMNQRVCKIKPKNQNLIPGLFCLLRSKRFQNAMIKMSDGGTAQKNLSTIELEKSKFSLLSEQDFEEFSNIVSKHIEFYINNLKEIDVLENMKVELIKLANNVR